MLNQNQIDQIVQVFVAIGSFVAAYNAWRAKRATQSTHRGMHRLTKRIQYDGGCLNAIHCASCPENDR